KFSLARDFSTVYEQWIKAGERKNLKEDLNQIKECINRLFGNYKFLQEVCKRHSLSYVPAKKTLTTDMLQEHIDGNKVLALPVFFDQENSKFLVIDIDINTLCLNDEESYNRQLKLAKL